MRWRFILIAAALLCGACATPVPPKPAMAPFGVNGDFGYTARDLAPDRIEVAYRGAAVRVSAVNPHDDPKSKAELDKAYDLALWRAAQIAAARGEAALKVEKEVRNTDVVIQHRTVYRPDPFYDPFYGPYNDPFWPHLRPYGQDFGPAYDVDTVRTATSRAEVTLTVTLYEVFDPKIDGLLRTGDTLARLAAARSGAVY